ncbi:Transthyretin-like family protein [Caenorhabditis elegans]|uniref:Transthyretin-like family protein n=1 Tax=Caenorhabditis elegans TaxID=6239 RepID=Q22034_CAEEL|nr:Transthyretin-like family protein [Caenorhabditis elegans]CAA99912.2 Transthyretin-like family protein [Caenorhabditis elegans]|eukprot:NP_506227.2 TransThyretin-Related family domain [Caenorhabditis elegans]
MVIRLASLLVALTLVFCQEDNEIVTKNFLGIGRMQAVAVSGRLICNGRPATNIKIKLYENEILFDRLMEESRTDSNGQFRVSGSKREISRIDPKVNVYHKCNYNGLCSKKFTIKIPKDYINRGSQAERTYDIGTLNLANKYPGESTDCIN